MSDKWIIAIIVGAIIIFGVLGLFLNGKFTKKETIFEFKNVEESQVLEITIKNEEKGTLKVDLSKEVNDDKDEIEFKIVFDENGNVLNRDEIDSLTDDESYKNEIDKIVNKCINEKLYLFDHVSQSYSSYYSKR